MAVLVITATVSSVPQASGSPDQHIYQQQWVYRNPPSRCTWGRVDFSEPFGGVFYYFQAESLAQSYGGGSNCGIQSVAAGWIGARNDIFHWNGSSWDLCLYSNMSYNSSYTNTYQEITNSNADDCNTGWYGTIGYAEAWDSSANVWGYGGVWSGAMLY